METNFKRCGEGENVCNCKTEQECGYLNMSDDNEYSSCEDCGEDTQWEDCWSCGGEGGRGYEDDLQYEDPLWYSPGDFETCDICEGKGGYYICLNSKCSTSGPACN